MPHGLSGAGSARPGTATLIFPRGLGCQSSAWWAWRRKYAWRRHRPHRRSCALGRRGGIRLPRRVRQPGPGFGNSRCRRERLFRHADEAGAVRRRSPGGPDHRLSAGWGQRNRAQRRQPAPYRIRGSGPAVVHVLTNGHRQEPAGAAPALLLGRVPGRGTGPAPGSERQVQAVFPVRFWANSRNEFWELLPWISQIELNSLNMRPSGMERTIKLHTEPVNGHAIRSIPPLSWRNHLLTSLKVRNPRPLPKRLPRGGLFVLNDPITLSPIPSLPEWTILAPAEAG